MSNNVGTTDRMIRVFLGVGLLSLFILLDTNARWLGLIGVIPLLTAVVGTCPLYSLLGINTCSTTKHSP